MKVRVPMAGYSGPRHRGQESPSLGDSLKPCFVFEGKKLVSTPHPDIGMLGLNVGTIASSFMGIRTQVLTSECQVLYLAPAASPQT